MKRVVSVLIAPLACMAMLVPGEVHAGPRGDVPPPEPETPEEAEARRLKMVDDMTAWLPRLVGRFRIEGVVDFNAAAGGEPPDPLKLKLAKGLGDCVAVGAGPGVHCVINVVWLEEWNSQMEFAPGGAAFLSPASTLYGIDANASRIRYLQLDTDGLVTDGATVLKGDTLAWNFAGYCAGQPQGTCGQNIRIYAPPDGKFIQMYIEITADPRKKNLADLPPLATFNLYMRRGRQAPDGNASKASPRIQRPGAERQ